MFNTKTILGRCLLAAALAGSAMTAFAAPTSYHVAINTSGLSGIGELDLNLASGTTALPLTATLSNFSAAFGAVDPLYSGDYSAGANGSFTLVNGSGYNDLARFLSLDGAAASFDVTFSGAFLDTVGTEGGAFTVSLYDSMGSFVGPDAQGVAVFTLTAANPTVFDINATPGLAAVSAVPEPSALLMMTTGFGLLGFMVRRRKETSAS